MLDRILLWSTVSLCSSFYFNWTIEGLILAGQYDAALANLSAGNAVSCSSFAMLLRDACKIFRRQS